MPITAPISVTDGKAISRTRAPSDWKTSAAFCTAAAISGAMPSVAKLQSIPMVRSLTPCPSAAR